VAGKVPRGDGVDDPDSRSPRDPDQRPDRADELTEEDRQDAADTVEMMTAAGGFAGHVPSESDTERPQSAPDPTVGPD
jgi:hypothetical protein